MSRYIDADAFVADSKWCGLETAEQVLFALAHQPSIDIVRCKECKRTKDYFKQHTDRLVWCEKWKWAMNTNGYCSYGEKETDHE